MPDISVKLPPSFHFLNQFAPSQWATNPSLYRCAEACVAMADGFARPNEHILEHLMDYLYVKFIGPDVATDTRGTQASQIPQMLTFLKIGFVDMQPLVDAYNAGNVTPLHNELMAQNNQDVPQILVIADESQLYEYAQQADGAPGLGRKLHAWNDAGMEHCIFRIGYSTDQGYGLYGEPAAVGFEQPVKIPWSCIDKARIIHAFAVMPSGVVAPPSGFLFQQGTWPPPVAPTAATVDLAHITDILNVLKAASNATAQAISEIEAMLK